METIAVLVDWPFTRRARGHPQSLPPLRPLDNMTKTQARLILIALVHDGMDTGKLTAKAKQEIRDAVDVVLALVKA